MCLFLCLSNKKEKKKPTVFLKIEFYLKKLEGELTHLPVHSSDGCYGLELGAARFPMWVQLLKNLGHPPLLFQVKSRDLDQQWSSWDIWDTISSLCHHASPCSLCIL